MAKDMSRREALSLLFKGIAVAAVGAAAFNPETIERAAKRLDDKLTTESDLTSATQNQMYQPINEPGVAYAGQATISIQDYYSRASPIKDSNLPVGTRWNPYYISGVKGEETTITSSNGKAIVFKSGEFSGYYFDKNYGVKVQKIFKDGGTDTDKLSLLLKNHPNEKVGLYREGFMTLFDDKEQKGYILPIGKGVAQKIFEL